MTFNRAAPWQWLTPAAAALVFLSSPRAHAESPDPITLTWNAPEECPRVEEVQAQIRKLAGPIKSGTTPLSAEATVTRNGQGDLHLRLVVHSEAQVGERNIDGKSCKGLAGAVAVALVLLLHSDGPLDQRDLEQPPVPPGEAKPDSKPASSEANAPQQSKPKRPEAERTPPANSGAEARPTRRWHVLLQAPTAALSLGPLREPSVGLGAAAGLAFDRWRWLAGVTVFRAQERSTSNGDLQYGADIARFAVGVSACRAVVLSRVEIAPCVSVSVEHLSAQGKGSYVAAQTEAATWIAPGVGVQARLHVASWLSLVLGLNLQLETAQPYLYLEDFGPIEHLLPFAGTTTLGCEWIF